MFMPSFPLKALVLSIVTVILALAPLSSLTFWVESGSEVVYSRPNYEVVYKNSFLNALTGSNETRVRIEVQDRSGRPVVFVALLSGPTSKGVVEVGNMSGKGYAVKPIGKYVSEVRRLLRELNSDHESSGLGILVLLSTIIEENGEHYAAADAVTIPIIPGKAVGKEIIVKIKFTPIMKHKIEGKTASKNSEEQSQTTPPPTITHYCTYYEGQGFGPYCYYWKLVETIYETPSNTPDYIPMAITLLDSWTGRGTEYVQHSFTIALIKGKVEYVSFTPTLGFRDPVTKAITFYVPGPGYIKYREESVTTEILYDIQCMFHSKSSPHQSICYYLKGPGGAGTGYRYLSNFEGDAILSTGLRGKMWLARYAYLAGYPRIDSGSVLDDKVLYMWIVPLFNENKKIVFDCEVDDRWGDNAGIAERTLNWLKNAINYKYIDSSIGGYPLSVLQIYIDSGASSWLGAAIALGALILDILVTKGALSALSPALREILYAILPGMVMGLESGEATSQLYLNFGKFYIQLLPSYAYDYVNAFYGEMKDSYIIKAEENAKRRAPLMVFVPRTGD